MLVLIKCIKPSSIYFESQLKKKGGVDKFLIVFIIWLKLTIKKDHCENRADTPKILIEETIDALIR